MPRGGIREKINTIGRGPRERCRSVPRGGVKKKKRSVEERKHYRCVPRGVVKEEKEKKP